ncbi:tetratricopeptide repeat protein [Streptomyces sp. WMMC940]|uniref:tetratricopeptide repeat protein n=1 Tax=Streptomyces sp. WMMC940 TaxID=3015153 RepID=UPI0022B61F40|nr:tetratricopeptide repeat protein [Streptomyces sp. WMMC940]MCZ7462146.1 tetratricopeptide repeat protein [Streptomyces sp. WMMC940]
MWTGLGASVAVAAGAVTWAVMSHPATTPDGKSEKAPLTPLTAHALLQAGHVQAQHQDFDGAEATFKRVLEMEPRNKLAWYNVGVVSARDGRPADALKAYDAALKIDPSFTSALFNQAVLLKTSDPDRAIALLKRTVTINPKASTAHFQLGDALSRKGRDSQARDAYRRAVAADPSLRSEVPKKFRDSTRPSPSSTTSAGR